MVFIYEFGKRFGLTVKQAFNYLSRFKGIEFIDNITTMLTHSRLSR